MPTETPQNSAPRTRHIHFKLNRGASQGRGILEGLSSYRGNRVDWCFGINPRRDQLGPPHADALVGNLGAWMADMWDIEQRRMIVNTSRFADLSHIASVTCDDARVGRIAADHLLGKNLQVFAYFGVRSCREQAFAERVAEKGYSCQSFFLEGDWEQECEHWLANLPKCTGIMTFNDGMAVRLLWAAKSVGRSTPEDLAVIGVDADHVESLMAPVPITSVDPDFYTVGYRVAELLDRIFQGYDARQERIRIPPAGVIEQASTDFPGITDRPVLEAARFIRRHACEGINATDVVDATHLSRRSLERRFRDAFGRTLLDELQKVRITEAARLLARTRRPVALVARQSGFNTHAHLATVFHKTMGMSPTDYRHKHSDSAGPASSLRET